MRSTPRDTVLSLISLKKREEFHSPSLLKSNCTGMCNVMSVYNNSPCQYLILNFEEGKWSLSSNRYCSLFVPLTFLTLYLFLPLRASLMREQYFLLSLFHKTVSQCLNQQLISWVKEKKMWVQHVNVWHITKWVPFIPLTPLLSKTEQCFRWV